ncbi:Hypothetical protein D9617_12g035460 [Elsinoe fawcettii]|nr:Hypothetical protein D9617_12g035460 [Elsinoe fawcettii]
MDHKEPRWMRQRRDGAGPHSRKVVWFILALIAGVALLSGSWKIRSEPNDDERVSLDFFHKLHPEDVPWANIEPAEELSYHQCYDDLQCARLLLPMDWNNTDVGDGTVAIAIVRVPAKVPVTDPAYGGAIFVNPGGPGASGTQLAVREGRKLQTIVDASDSGNDSHTRKFFDIIGFDPRGVRHTSPRLICFPNEHTRRIWEIQSQAEGTVATSSIATTVKHARWTAMSQSCLERAKFDPRAKIIHHINTTPVVRDLLEMVDKHATGEREATPAGPHSRESTMARAAFQRGKEQLNFWGQSYGTYIGAMFAAMCPDHVGRLILDSVKPPSEGLRGTRGSAIIHADAIVAKFFELCSAAGLEKCPLQSLLGAREMQQDFDQLLSDLESSPMSVFSSSTTGPEIITWTDLIGALRSSLYDPMKSFPGLARLIESLLRGQGTYFAAYKARTKPPFNISSACADDGPFSPSCMLPVGWEDEASPAVSCSDADDNGLNTVEHFDEYLKHLENQSRYIAKPWAELNMKCAGWTAKAKWRFAGPFAANTSHPILIVNNLLDPVTPVENAIEIAKSYPGSVVLKQNGIGHVTVDTKSACTTRYIRDYFQTGTMPPANVTCEVDELPFGLGPAAMPLGW